MVLNLTVSKAHCAYSYSKWTSMSAQEFAYLQTNVQIKSPQSTQIKSSTDLYYESYKNGLANPHPVFLLLQNVLYRKQVALNESFALFVRNLKIFGSNDCHKLYHQLGYHHGSLSTCSNIGQWHTAEYWIDRTWINVRHCRY